jgi:hypothetical protein
MRRILELEASNRQISEDLRVERYVQSFFSSPIVALCFNGQALSSALSLDRSRQPARKLSIACKGHCFARSASR